MACDVGPFKTLEKILRNSFRLFGGHAYALNPTVRAVLKCEDFLDFCLICSLNGTRQHAREGVDTGWTQVMRLFRRESARGGVHKAMYLEPPETGARKSEFHLACGRSEPGSAQLAADVSPDKGIAEFR
jgi:hypothetical protein